MTSQTKSLPTFVPWAKQYWVLSVQTCLQSLGFSSLKMLTLLAALSSPASEIALTHSLKHCIIPGPILERARFQFSHTTSSMGSISFLGEIREKLLDHGLLQLNWIRTRRYAPTHRAVGIHAHQT